MAHIYHLEEWECNGKWYVGDVSALAANSNLWWYAPRLLSISPVDYVALLIKEYNVKYIKYNARSNVLIFAFDSLKDCRIYKNYINKLARQNNFIIY